MRSRSAPFQSSAQAMRIGDRPSPLAVWPFTHRAGKVSLGTTRAGRISREERPLWGRLQSPRRRILENDPDTIIE